MCFNKPISPRVFSDFLIVAYLDGVIEEFVLSFLLGIIHSFLSL